MKKTINLLIILVGFTSIINAQVMVSTLAGTTTAGYVDGTGSVARFWEPRGICLSSGDILVADGLNHTIRKISTNGLVSTPQYLISSSPLQYATTYNTYEDICRDASGNIYFICGSSITKITPTGNMIFNFAGYDGFQGYVDGMGSIARFNIIKGMCIDPSGNIYVVDCVTSNGKIRKITPSGTVSTFISSNVAIQGICCDASGNIFYTSASGANGSVYKATPAGVVTLVAGGASTGLLSVRYGEGTIGAAVTFASPVYGICIDNIGNLYVTGGAGTIQKIDTNGAVTTFAGAKKLNASGTGLINITTGYVDGAGDIAKFGGSAGEGADYICTDNNGNFYVSDKMNNCIRKISVIPTFTQIAPICYGSNLVLPNTSNNGLTGTWSPAINNTATTTYTFTPTGGNGISTTMTIEVNPNITSTFQQVNSICSGATLSALPTTSNNSITGTWSPALNNTATTIYTFTPTTGQCATTTTMTIIVNPLPANAGIISGNANVCQGQNAVTYTVPAIANTTSYIWALPSGASGTSTTNSISINFGSSAVSGNITVKGNNSCGDGLTSTLPITVNPLPSNAGTISGSTMVCKGQNSVTYTVPTIANATSYVWTLPTGVTGTSTTNSITVNYGNSAVSGNITVKGNNTCGDGLSSTLPITVNQLPANAGTISGNTTVCQGQNSITYSVPSISGATSYVWTLPNGVTGTSTTNSINVNFSTSAVSGGIEVYGQNSCGSGSSSIIAVSVNSYPVTAGTISGSTTVCQGQNTITYTVTSIANATSYVWTLPNGATGTSNSNSITVNYGTSAISGNITVKGNNSCGFGTSSSLPIIVNSLPSNAGTISGTTTVCQGQTSVFYAVPSIANATSYSWTLPSGASGISTTNTINVNYSNSSVSGNLIVSGNNSCGSGTSFSLPITVIITPPPTGNISQNSIQGQTLSNLQVTGTNLIWYANQSDAINHVSPITNATLLVNGATYYVTQTNNGCESAPLGITVTVALGINDFQKDRFVYYPNPVNSILNFENNNPILKITLFNLLGQRVEEKEINSLSGQLDMSKLPTGNYLLKFKTDNGESTIKLVKN